MKEIKRRITLVLQLTQYDFSTLNEVIRQCSQLGLHAVTAPRISDATRLLQYMDTFTQKLTHILSINQALMNTKVMRTTSSGPFANIDSAGFIFRLNYFQAKMAQGEFRSTMDHLQRIIYEFGGADYMKSVLAPSDEILFKHLKKGEANMTFLLLTLQGLYTDRQEEHAHAVCLTNDVLQIRNHYTMDSERLILDWMQTHPDSQVEDLLHVYMRNAFGQVKEQTELF